MARVSQNLSKKIHPRPHFKKEQKNCHVLLFSIFNSMKSVKRQNYGPRHCEHFWFQKRLFTMWDSKFFKVKGLNISTNPLGVLTDAPWCLLFTKFPQKIFFKNCLSFTPKSFFYSIKTAIYMWVKLRQFLKKNFWGNFVNKGHHGASVKTPS